VDIREIWWAGSAIQADLAITVLNPVASTIPKWRTFKLLRWVHPLNRLDEILYFDNGIKGDLHHSKMVVCLSVLARTSC
jgi:energy-converting hydrogenase Eha subunit F